MPHVARPCKYPRCPKLSKDSTGYCTAHAHYYTPTERPTDNRQSACKRGYDRHWQEIRRRVLLAHRIPKAEWHLYDIHHEPPYNPAIEPDHLKYQLTPLLHADHSRHTARQGGGSQSLQPSGVNRLLVSDTHTGKSEVRGWL